MSFSGLAMQALDAHGCRCRSTENLHWYWCSKRWHFRWALRVIAELELTWTGSRVGTFAGNLHALENHT